MMATFEDLQSDAIEAYKVWICSSFPSRVTLPPRWDIPMRELPFFNGSPLGVSRISPSQKSLAPHPRVPEKFWDRMSVIDELIAEGESE